MLGEEAKGLIVTHLLCRGKESALAGDIHEMRTSQMF